MTVDVDAVNEKLNGLVNLLQIVGIDGVDPNALVNEQQRLSKGSSSTSTPKTAQSTDSQILEIIKKLQIAQADSPEILAALQSPELRALASLAAQKQKPAEPAPAPAPSLGDVMEDEDDNYPKIGPGYSDDISVVSDLTTPTVMTKQNVAEEEYYKDVNGGGGGPPPMHIGGGPRPPMSVGGGGKSKNRLGNVSAAKARSAIAKTGGAAAQRRLNYQQAMAKLQSDEYGNPVNAPKDKNYMEDFDPQKQPFQPQSSTTTDPSEFPSMSDGKKKSKTKDKRKSKSKKNDASVDGMSKASKSSKSKTSSDGIDWGNSGDTGWDAFDNFEAAFGSDPFGASSNGGSKIGDDGFFSNDVFANADPFATNSKSGSTTKKKKNKKSRDDGQGTRTRTEKPKKKGGGERRQRRASLQM